MGWQPFACKLGDGLGRLFEVTFDDTASPVLLRLPRAFECPITGETARDPVLTVDGHCYDRNAITAWFERGRITSPVTNKPLPSTELVPCGALQALVEAYLGHRSELCSRELRLREQDAAVVELRAQRENQRMALVGLTKQLMEVEAQLHEDPKVAVAEVRARLATLSDNSSHEMDASRATQAMAPSGGTLAIGCERGQVIVADPAAGLIANVQSGIDSSSSVFALGLSPSGGKVAVGGPSREHYGKGMLQVIGVGTRQVELEVLHGGTVEAVAWSPSGASVATASADRLVSVIDVATGTMEMSIGHSGVPRAVAWSPSGDRLATGDECAESKLRVVDACSGWKEVEVRHDGAVCAIAWSASGGRVASGGHDEVLRLIDALTGRVDMHVQHEGRIYAVAWSPCGARVASGCWDRMVRIIGTTTGCVEAVLPHCFRVVALAWSPEGHQLASGTAGGLRLFGARSGWKEAKSQRVGAVCSISWSS